MASVEIKRSAYTLTIELAKLYASSSGITSPSHMEAFLDGTYKKLIELQVDKNTDD